jgi:hypothetical protein
MESLINVLINTLGLQDLFKDARVSKSELKQSSINLIADG